MTLANGKVPWFYQLYTINRMLYTSFGQLKPVDLLVPVYSMAFVNLNYKKLKIIGDNITIINK